MRRRMFSRIAAIAAGVAGVAGGFVLLAPGEQTRILTSTGAHIRPTEPWAALAMLLMGLALGAVVLSGTVWVKRIATAIAAVTLVAGLTSEALHVLGATPSADSILGALIALRVIGGVVIVSSSAGLLLVSLDRFTKLAGAFALLLIVIGSSMLIALAYGGPLFIQREWPMVGFPAALASSFFGIALICANGESAWPLRAFVGPSVSALLLRYLLPVVVLSVLLTGAASSLFFSGFSPAIGSTLNTIISLAMSSAVVVALGRVIGARMDRSYAALTASEDKFRRVFKALPAGLAISRLNDGRFVDVNDEFIKTFGHPKDEVLGHTSTELGMWNDESDRENLVKSLRARGNQREIELYMKAKGGRDLSLRTSIHVLDLDGEPSMVSTFIDVTETKRTEAARMRSETQRSAVFNNSPVAIVVSDADSGAIIEVNQAYLDLVEARSAREIIGKTAAELGFWTDTNREQTLVEPLRKFGRVEGAEVSFRSLRGNIRTHQVWAVYYEADGARFLLSSLVDITERKRVEAERAKLEVQFTAIFRESPVALSVTNVATGKLIAVNPAFLEAYAAKSEADVLGKSRGELGIWGPEVRQTIVDQLNQGKRAHGVFQVKRLDGEFRMFQVSASTYKVDGEVFSLGASMDVTDRLRAEEERSKAQKQYQELFSGVRDVVFSLSPDGVITVLNPAFQAVTGMPTTDWIGKTFAELVHKDDAERAIESLRRSLDGHPKDEPPIRIKTSSGYRFAEVISAPRLEEGRVVGILGIGRDVSDRITLEDQLRQSQKMEAMGSLAGGIAHDFNNLLTVIIGFGQMTLASAEGTLKEDVTEMVNAAERAAEMTRQLLAFSRKQVRELRDVDVNKILDGVEKMLRRMIGSHVKLKSEHAPDLGIIRADAGQLEQVVANLTVNARDAMPNGGTVTISTANVVLDEAFAARHTGAQPGAFIRLSVADTGSGMTPEIREKIFEPFFTTKEVGKGTGLGLSTVFGIVQQSQGFVVVDSEVGKGTAFDIYFPRVEAQSAAAATTRRASATSHGTETVLLAEDNPALRSLSVRALSERGYNVLAAANGDEALVMAQQHEGTIDLLITDVVMPGMSGRALAEGLARVRPGIRVLYVSGYSDEMLGQQGVLDDGITLLAKPFTPDSLAAKVRSVLDRSGT